jgi:hypothetical protein
LHGRYLGKRGLAGPKDADARKPIHKDAPRAFHPDGPQPQRRELGFEVLRTVARLLAE